MSLCCPSPQEVADQRVPDELMALAMQNPRFRRSRQKHQKKIGMTGKGGKREGKGRGSGGNYRVRPGLGATSEVCYHWYQIM